VRVTATVAAIALLAAVSVEAQSLIISRGGSRPVRLAPAQNFTGTARVEMLFDAVDPSDASAGTVTFEPGARTAWHSHPRGQVLIVTAGIGRVQRWGDPIEQIRAGDVVRIPAGQKHWHGAAPGASMTHIAITEHRDGTTVQWMEAVTDAQYDGAPAQTPGPPKPSGEVQPRVAPGMAALTDDVLFGDVWRRPELSPRDRSLVTISILIATGRSSVLAGHLGRALDNGLLPSEASGVLAHLAVYAGWPSAVSALDVYDQVYAARKIETAALRATGPRLPAPASDVARARALSEELGGIAPKLVQLTNEVVFDDLWRRPDLSPRDRSLVTVAALAAMGDADQLDPYVRRGLENGLTRDQIAEALTHLGFYAGWSKAMAAMTAVARAFGK
ncbi:MAG TPA: carboxymuconolactone decarboxylase family protein, partial [Vicinamibacteria bacterium]|nr:carboxymuconolactone decarboxylase family protein [Vicinamibacteria bacterium]